MKIRANVADAMLAAVMTAIDAGTGPGHLFVYQGTEGDMGGSTLIADFELEDPGSSVSTLDSTHEQLTLIANATISATAVATGNAQWFRIADSTDSNVLTGTVPTDLSLSNASISSGDTITFSQVRVFCFGTFVS